MGPLLASIAGPPGSSAAIRLLICLFASTLISDLVAAATLPYIPTTVLLPTPKAGKAGENATSDIAYVFSPSESSVDLLALNVSTTLKASSLSPQTLTSGLPFYDGNDTAFVPSVADNGSLVVYAGDCSQSIKPGIWTYSPSANDGASAFWVQQTTSLSTYTGDAQLAPNFLAGGLSFSTTLEPEISQENTYVYGGMCPDSSANATSSQARATYSNQMISIAPSESDLTKYIVSPVESKGPPVAEAGFTLTGLHPSISNVSGYVTQQVNYVLLGGHTQNAFINMSTVAIWSLPEESWGFISDLGMASSQSTDTELLAAKSAAAQSIDSRSGHTAVLNEDGTALVVFGGWVGDQSQAASPQLAVLEIGAGYGGQGDWQWLIPDEQPSGGGIYGHGAALLPGNVMMVYGGYSISSTGSKSRRQTTEATPSFLNLTSLTFSDEYTNPSYAAANSSGGSKGGKSRLKMRLGLGLGLGLGLAALIAALIAWMCWRHRLGHRRQAREAAIRDLAQDSSRYVTPEEQMLEPDDFGGGGADAWYTGGADPYARAGRSLGARSLGRGSMDHGGGGGGGRQNWFGDLPPATTTTSSSSSMQQMQQIARKPVGAPRAARGQYESVPCAGGGMNPIWEAEEDEEDDENDAAGAGAAAGLLAHGGVGRGTGSVSPVRGEAASSHHRDSGAYSDPFVTPTQERAPAAVVLSFPPPLAAGRASATPSPEERHRGATTANNLFPVSTPATDPDVQDWMSDVDAADAMLSGRSGGVTRPGGSAAVAAGAGGRLVPTRHNTVRSTYSQQYAADDEGGGSSLRTGSNLSESNRSYHAAGGAPSRSGSLRAAAAAAAAFADEIRGGSSSSSSAPSYNTARSSFPPASAAGAGAATGSFSFPALQAEGPSLLLLGGNHRNNNNNNADGAAAADDEQQQQPPGSPSKRKPRYSWFGSLKRAFSGPTPSPSPPGSSGRDDGGYGYNSGYGYGYGYGSGGDGDPLRGSLGELASGGLLRRKGGRGAWERVAAGGAGGLPSPSSSGQAGGGYAPLKGVSHGDAGADEGNDVDDDDDWDDDIERAVERRLVQVMFTVPRERLRVVNAEPEIDSGESVVLVDPDRGEDVEEEEEEEESPVLVEHPEHPDHDAVAAAAAAAAPQQLRETAAAGPPEPSRAAAATTLSPAPMATSGGGRSIRTPSPRTSDDSHDEGAASAAAAREALRAELDAEWARTLDLDRELDALRRANALAAVGSAGAAADYSSEGRDSALGDSEVGVIGGGGGAGQSTMAGRRDDVKEEEEEEGEGEGEKTRVGRGVPEEEEEQDEDDIEAAAEETSSRTSPETPRTTGRPHRGLHKPRSRVLAMVEDIESKSGGDGGSSSPAGSPSPTRGSPSPARGSARRLR
ncbi:hypothetical protein GGR56DRAFT_681459 [Xylariaceae sp. FL0804]|nr:hypothetical protein GGR56DRAFT_681459 [Xylariaceae sp. FL0804]